MTIDQLDKLAQSAHRTFNDALKGRGHYNHWYLLSKLEQEAWKTVVQDVAFGMWAFTLDKPPRDLA